MGNRSCQAVWLVRYIPCLLKWYDSSVWGWNLSKFSHWKFDSCHHSLVWKRPAWASCYKKNYIPLKGILESSGSCVCQKHLVCWMFLTILQYGYFTQKWEFTHHPHVISKPVWLYCLCGIQKIFFTQWMSVDSKKQQHWNPLTFIVETKKRFE